MVTVYGVVEYCACAYASLRYMHVYIRMCDIVSTLVNDPSNVLCCVCVCMFGCTHVMLTSLVLMVVLLLMCAGCYVLQ